MGPKEVDRIRQAYAGYEQIGKWEDENPGRDWAVNERAQAIRELFPALSRPLAECRLLDVGCGRGNNLGWFHKEGARAANLTGVDLLPANIEAARRRYPDFEFHEANAEHLDFPDGAFDVISVINVFSSILDDQMAANVARSMARVLKDDGVIIWSDIRYPNPQNHHVRAMTKSRIMHLFPRFACELTSLGLMPPIYNRLGRSTPIFYPALARIPVLRSHYFGTLRPEAPAG